MEILKNYSLKALHTFHTEVSARYFAVFRSLPELQELLGQAPRDQRLLLLGGGSNILFTRDVDGLVLKNEIMGIETVHEDERHVYIRAGAGVNWHRFVLHCIQKDLGGVENLSLIPGNVGATPMQNIGAYGVEIRDVFHSLDAYHLRERRSYTFSANDCEFGYRDSIFKRKYRDQFAILNVTFALDKVPRYKTSYGALEEELKKMNMGRLSVRAISEAVVNIRTAKLPDPAVLGNAGSFFKNPQVATAFLQQLPGDLGKIPSYPVDDLHVKIPAGWLIEQCGWKGFRRGDAGCYDRQALVLVNYGHATGSELARLGDDIAASVFRKFGIHLEREVNVI